MNMCWEREYWTSQDGTIHYPEHGTMDLNHMNNCIALMERNMDSYYTRYGRTTQSRDNFAQMIRTSRIYTILQACIARRESETNTTVVRPSAAWGIRGGN